MLPENVTVPDAESSTFPLPEMVVVLLTMRLSVSPNSSVPLFVTLPVMSAPLISRAVSVGAIVKAPVGPD